MAEGPGRPRSLAVSDTWFVRLLLIATVMLTVISAVRPMASYRALALGANPFEIGLLPAAFAGLSLLVAVPAGRWIDRLGEAPFLLFGTAVMGASALVMVWIDSIPLLVASQATLGLGHIVNIIAAQTMIANRSPAHRRDHRYGYYSVVASVGQLLGPIIGAGIAGSLAGEGGASVGASAVPVFAVAAVASVPATLVALSLMAGLPRRGASAPEPPEHGYMRSAAEILRMPTMVPAMLISVGVILSVDLLIAYLPVYGEERGLPVELVGALLSVRAASSMASRLAMGMLIDRVGRGRLLYGSAALAGVSLALVPLVGEAWMLVVLMVLTGLGLGFGQPMTIAWVAARAPRSLRATALGIRLTGNRIGQLVIPALVGAAAGLTGLATVFWSMSVVLLGSALVVLRTTFEVDEEVEEELRPERA